MLPAAVSVNVVQLEKMNADGILVWRCEVTALTSEWDRGDDKVMVGQLGLSATIFVDNKSVGDT